MVRCEVIATQAAKKDVQGTIQRIKDEGKVFSLKSDPDIELGNGLVVSEMFTRKDEKVVG